MDNNEKIFSSDPQKYFIVVTEWNYPVESGRDVDSDYDTKEDALERCQELCKEEYSNFLKVCGEAHEPRLYYNDNDVIEGVNIVPKHRDDWWFAAKVIEVKHGMPMNVMKSMEHS